MPYKPREYVGNLQNHILHYTHRTCTHRRAATNAPPTHPHTQFQGYVNKGSYNLRIVTQGNCYKVSIHTKNPQTHTHRTQHLLI